MEDSQGRMKRCCVGVLAVMILLAMVFVHVDCRVLTSMGDTRAVMGIGREHVGKGNATGFVRFGDGRKGRWAFKHASGPSKRGPGH